MKPKEIANLFNLLKQRVNYWLHQEIKNRKRRKMKKENFPCVGFFLGWWIEIHEESFLQNIELVNQDKEKCELWIMFRKNENEKISKRKYKPFRLASWGGSQILHIHI